MKKATVFLKGGFGNQLFQLCFAEFLRKNEFNVFINTDLLKVKGNHTPRQLTLPLRYFGFKEQNYLEKKRFNYFLKLNSSSVISRSVFGNAFSKYKFTKELFDIEDLNKKEYFFNEYWKDMRFINENNKFLTSSLSNNEIIKEGLDSKIKDDYAMVHVRRRDFLDQDWQLNVSYYEKSLSLLKDLNSEIKFDVFTDDLEWVKNQEIFSEAQNIYSQRNEKLKNQKELISYQKDDTDDTIRTFSEMLKYKNFVVGNSSFAFFAAFIQSDSTSLVTVPVPWFRNNPHKTLKKDNWIVVDNN